MNILEWGGKVQGNVSMGSTVETEAYSQGVGVSMAAADDKEEVDLWTVMRRNN